ncbi:PucR family transcriptional regulator [Staphylococcus carnosus]|uniref:PucR family transcriptional regulator n=2 Tax=Staphylococcus carnosus TaxID=1281 RepID=B9DKH0_STACT|nr:PucR family transcriptional regulator [Staphylococcus carnosus]KOR13075.1 PucR family transcriptional regulator [Staphylococcus carnosus]QPT05030.1 PucR family transcriptional regulator [Staphylococcus carnosus]UQA67755.1 PucR family transcriptional regulator [Staphylococcus carnosus]UTB77422.1 PucR family transcriptional regulator [Staphylococcus carnosus]UTB86966.1 PucR family transcriptional regulator [Staphylococcus carnosus]
MPTLKDILSAPSFAGLKLINSEGDLNREVDNLDISENDDIKDYTAKKSFILTTGLLFKENQNGLKKLIKELKEIDTAGLGIKTSRYLKEINQDIVDYANELEFPLIDISEDWNLGEITRQMANYISDEQTSKLNYALNIQEELNDMLIKGFDVEAMIERMSRLLKVPVLLFNPFKRVETESWHYQQNYRLLQKHMKYFLDYIESEKANTITRNQTNYDNEKVIFKVQSFAYFPYYLMVSDINKLSYPFSLLTIEQIVTTLSFAIYKNQKIQEAANLDLNRFFESLLTNRSDQLLSVHKHPSLFRQYGIYPSDYYQVIICGIDPTDTLENSQYVNERQTFVYKWLKHKLTDLDPKISIYNLSSNKRFAILLQHQHEYYIHYLKYLQKNYHEFFDSSISFGVGNKVTEFSQLNNSFAEANEAFENYLEKNKKEFITFYHSKNMKELLQLIPPDKLKPFINNILGPLSHPKTKKDEELKDTLKIYMDYQCDITKTAKMMYIHRNTVKYRINKCEELLGFQIEDPLNSLNLRLALYASDEITFD